MSASRPEATSRPAARIATRLHSASASRKHVRAEEHRAAAIAQPQHQRADIAPAEWIEARHRLVEEHDLRLVDQRLRDADALHHALRELAQLHPPLGADPDVVEQPRRARAALGAAIAEQAAK